jgi:hypothetical protein
MPLDPAHLHILRHSLGLDDEGRGNQYRNYYCAAVTRPGWFPSSHSPFGFG